MDNERTYRRRLSRLEKEQRVTYKDNKINLRPENVKLAINYLKDKEVYLRRSFGVNDTAKGRYFKTLHKELTYVQNVLYWFNKWDLDKVSENEITEVYDNLENDTLRSIKGHKLKDTSKKDYYAKVLKNGFFEYINKDEIAKKVVIRKFQSYKKPRYFEFETLIQLSNALRFNDHKLLVWLMFDTGIEINAILRLEKKDFELRKREGKPDKYFLRVPLEISKKSRSPRNFFIFFDETTNLLNEILVKLEDHDLIFNFGWRNAYKLINETSKELNLKLKSHNEYIKPKDFRSSMSRYFYIVRNWDDKEVKARLGHKPSSTILDVYSDYDGVDNEKVLEQEEVIDLKNYKEKYKEIGEDNRRLQETVKNLDNNLDHLKTELEARSVMIQGIFEGFSNEELLEMIEKQRKKKGLPSFKELYSKQ